MSTPQAERQRKLREHYRQHLVTPRAGRPYNPLLDDPNHPDNIRHWTHGTREGYGDAGCRCDPSCRRGDEDELTCTEANALYARQARQRALDRLLEGHAEKIRSFLRLRVPVRDSGDLEEGVTLILSGHTVDSIRGAKVSYARSALELALRAWHPEMPDQERKQLAGVLDAQLNEEG